MKQFLILIFIGFLVSGCLEQGGTGTESGTTGVITPAADPKLTICDPFKTNSPSAADRGLIGNLLYLTDDQPRYSNVTSYIQNAAISSQTIYLDRVFVPTRPFDRGFFTQSGDLVLNGSGSTLYEYFALRLQSQLSLSANENPGLYQLALLADDGALMKINDATGVEKTIVNNDGTHATKMACATEPVYLDRNTKIPMTLEYYQGPRFHIALVVMWRPWPDGVTNTDPVNDVSCGLSGNSYFFDSTQNPVVPKAPYYELLARGWKPLENENYSFPKQDPNPCVTSEETLSISNFALGDLASSEATVSWTTNVSSTSQVEFKNITTGVIMRTAEDSTMTQNHTVTITGLSSFTLYGVKALSRTSSGQNAVSDELAFRTRR